MATTTKPPALCARCPDCGTHDVPLRNGAFTAHRRTVPTSRSPGPKPRPPWLITRIAAERAATKETT